MNEVSYMANNPDTPQKVFATSNDGAIDARKSEKQAMIEKLKSQLLAPKTRSKGENKGSIQISMTHNNVALRSNQTLFGGSLTRQQDPSATI